MRSNHENSGISNLAGVHVPLPSSRVVKDFLEG